MKQTEIGLSKKLVVNDLLCFVQNNLKILNQSSLRRLCEETYMPDEIKSSFQELKDNVQSLDPMFHVHLGNNTSSKAETLNAIIHCFNSKACKLIQFVSSGCNMPRMNMYRDMLSITCVLDELKELKQLVKTQTELMTAGFYRLSNELEKLKDTKENKDNQAIRKGKERKISSSIESVISNLSRSPRADEKVFNSFSESNCVSDLDNATLSSQCLEQLKVSNSVDHQVEAVTLRKDTSQNSSQATHDIASKARRRAQNNISRLDSFKSSINRLSNSKKLYKKHSCKVCGYVGNLTDVTRHMRTHTGERPYSCPLCSTRFTLRGNMIKHLARKHGTFLSSHIPKEVAILLLLQGELNVSIILLMKANKRLPSSASNSEKLSSEKLDNSLKTVPSTSSVDVSTSRFLPLPLSAPYQEQRSNMKITEEKTDNDDISLNVTLSLPELPDVKTEDIIEEDFPSSSYSLTLDPHEEAILTTSSFTTSSLMNDISSASSAVATYNPMLHMQATQQDNAPASSAQALDRFVANQLQKKRHRCDICGYTSNASDVTRHKRTHTGERPYSCPVCEARFALRGNMTKHLTRMHPSYQP